MRASARSTIRRRRARPASSGSFAAADVPVNLITLLSLIQFGKDDEPSLASDVVRYKGEPILGIVATSERAALEAMVLVRISYDQLPAVYDVEEAIKPGAPSINPAYPKNTFEYYNKYDHQKLRYGDVDAGLRTGGHRVRGAIPDVADRARPHRDQRLDRSTGHQRPLIVYTSTQALFFSLDTSAKINAVPSNQLHFIGGTVGGGFGGKVDTLTEPLSILAARLTGAPVRYRFSRRRGNAIRLASRRPSAFMSKTASCATAASSPAPVRALFRQRRLTRLSSSRCQMRRAHSGALHDPERVGRCVLRLHQPHTGHRYARLRRYRARLRSRMPDGQRRDGDRHGSARIPHPQRLSRRRHESAPARSQELRTDRMRASRRREGQLAVA